MMLRPDDKSLPGGGSLKRKGAVSIEVDPRRQEEGPTAWATVERNDTKARSRERVRFHSRLIVRSCLRRETSRHGVTDNYGLPAKPALNLNP